ncbi:MAG: prephenate dehydrogenase/arogenate dehydrogenase family protein [Planctomycetota bacterium]|nr:prephenate dehydrogenase/arogenate dehydrogenase family protein [Planctomycetota bacterium]
MRDKPVMCIAGLGLIGGSMALALKRKRFARRIVGVDVSPRTLKLALVKGVIDEAESSLVKGAFKADILLLSMPINEIIRSLRILSDAEVRCSLIMDTGSTKTDIIAAASESKIMSSCFVGGHPMAGSEKSGIESAHPDIFSGATFFLTPLQNTEPSALEMAKSLVYSLDSTPLEITPERHDRIVAFTSHLPYLVSLGLSHTVSNESTIFSELPKAISSGFKSSTRLSVSPSELWADILSSNSKNIIEALDLFNSSLKIFSDILRRSDTEQLRKVLALIRSKHEALLEDREE